MSKPFKVNKRIHMVDCNFECNHCGREFDSKKEALNHVRKTGHIVIGGETIAYTFKPVVNEP